MCLCVCAGVLVTPVLIFTVFCIVFLCVLYSFSFMCIYSYLCYLYKRKNFGNVVTTQLQLIIIIIIIIIIINRPVF